MTRERGEQAVGEDERERLEQLATKTQEKIARCASEVDPTPPPDWNEAEDGQWACDRCEELRPLADGLQRLLADRARLSAENVALQKTVAIRQRMIDIPTAWELTLATPEDQHHERCSYRTAKMLCDCAAFCVMQHVSGLLETANQRADAAEARVQALQEENVLRVGDCLRFSWELLHDMVIRDYLEREFWPSRRPVKLEVVEVRRSDGSVELVVKRQDEAALAPSQGAGE